MVLQTHLAQPLHKVPIMLFASFLPPNRFFCFDPRANAVCLRVPTQKIFSFFFLLEYYMPLYQERKKSQFFLWSKNVTKSVVIRVHVYSEEMLTLHWLCLALKPGPRRAHTIIWILKSIIYAEIKERLAPRQKRVFYSECLLYQSMSLLNALFIYSRIKKKSLS